MRMSPKWTSRGPDYSEWSSFRTGTSPLYPWKGASEGRVNIPSAIDAIPVGSTGSGQTSLQLAPNLRGERKPEIPRGELAVHR
jgi:hypothetical protein